jgi:cobalt-zinc-cadmium efflux system outer membrane protein
LNPRLALAFLALIGPLLVAGCAHYELQPKPVLDRTAAEFAARSLDNPELRRFLARNLGHEPAAWDFETLTWAAFYYNPNLDLARAQWESAQAATRSAGARPNPTLVLTPGYNTSAGAGVSPWFPALNFEFLVETTHKRELRAEGARLAAEVARQAIFTAVWSVRSELRNALLDFQITEQRSANLRLLAEDQKRIVTVLDQRLRAGAIARPESATARLALVRAEIAAADATRQVAIARQRVTQTLSLPLNALDDTLLPAPPGAPQLTPEQLTAARRAALQNRADVLGALAHYDAAHSALALEVAKQRPDLHLGPGYQWDQGDSKWSLALSFELPIFNHNEGPIAEAEAKRREAAAQFVATQARVLLSIDSAMTAQQSATAQITQLQRLLVELERQLASTTARQRAGRIDRLESETAQLEHDTGKLAVLEAQSQSALASGQLEDALQIPFPNLAALVQPAPASSPSSSP